MNNLWAASPGEQEANRWEFHDTTNPLIRFLRDRRLQRVVQELVRQAAMRPDGWGKVLVVCGGVGGEGTFLKKQGFRNVTVSDFDAELLKVMGQRDPDLHGVACDAQKLPFADQSFDLVLVQDGIHHLKNPVLGVTEMLRVARRAMVLIEPHDGVVARLFGTQIERENGHENFVFRWNRRMFEQVVESYLVGMKFQIRTDRFWDHSLAMLRNARWLPNDCFKLFFIRLAYWLMDKTLPFLGNMFTGIVLIKCVSEKPAEKTRD